MKKLIAAFTIATTLATGCTVVFPIVSSARHTGAPVAESNQAVASALAKGAIVDLLLFAGAAYAYGSMGDAE